MKRSLLVCGLILSLLGSLSRVGVARSSEPARVTFAELYASVGVPALQFCEKVKALAEKPVALRGFMALSLVGIGLLLAAIPSWTRYRQPVSTNLRS